MGCCMSTDDTISLKKMLLSNNLRRLSLGFVSLAVARSSIVHLAQGFEELQKMANKGTVIRLHSLIMGRLEAVSGRPLKIRSRLLRSLRGLPSLKTLHLQESCDSSILPSVLGEDVLLHPQCAIETLHVFWERYNHNVQEEETPDQLGERWNKFWEAMETNTSVRDFMFRIPNDIINSTRFAIRKFFELAVSPHCQMDQIGFGESCSLGEDGFPLTSILPLSADVNQGGGVSGNKLRNMRLFSLQEWLLPNWENDIRNWVELRRANIKVFIKILSDHCPLLCNFEFIDGYRIECVEEDIIHDEGKESQTLKDWHQVQRLMHLNKTGRVLLHPTVAPSIPLGLWPLVLQKAANIRGEEQHRLELDGAYYMVQGLSQRGILTPAGTTMTTPVAAASVSSGEPTNLPLQEDSCTKRKRVGV